MAVKKTSTKKSATKKSATKKTTTKSSKVGDKKVKKATATAKTTATKKVSKPSTSFIEVGQKVPDFKAEATQGQVQLKNLKGQKVILYFYPKDHTSGCTTEGHDFSNAKTKFKKKNAVIYGVSRDSLKSHTNFIEKQAYKIDLISDPDEKLCHLFGVMKEKSMYGRKYVGVDRSTFVIDEKGVLIHAWRGVKVPGHVDEVYKAI